MKNLLLLTAASFTLLLISCSVGQGDIGQYSDQTAAERRLDNQANQSLADVLKKNTSLQVYGQGSNVTVVLRGTSTLGGHGQHTQPLYVIDGVAVGNNYNAADRIINPEEIVSVNILSSLSEVATYGERGNHGVIKIKTKKGR